MDWDRAVEALAEIEVRSNQNNEPVTVKGSSKHLHCIGVGTDAAVFRFKELPQYAFKLYSESNLDKMKMEELVYVRLGQSSYFPTIYGSGPNFLVISYEEGNTLYDCLLKGIHIPEQAIQDVEDARDYAVSKGLNPRDIHLKNILLHEGRAKLLDVSEYMKEGNDRRWEQLKAGYEMSYPLIDGKAIPHWIMETVRKWYHQENSGNVNIHEFVHKLMSLFKIV
ncbi:serine/threonine protein kinase [bacterium LRH843]|nr:serine/threonine protein kinase [bacterium LRH843]